MLEWMLNVKKVVIWIIFLPIYSVQALADSNLKS